MASIIRRTYKVTTPDGRTVVKRCDHYTVRYRDAAGKIERVKGYTDKAATKQLAAKLEGRPGPRRAGARRPVPGPQGPAAG